MVKCEYEKCKKDIVYFAEEYLGLTLLPWQRYLLQQYNKPNIMQIAEKRSGKQMLVDIINKYDQFQDSIK